MIHLQELEPGDLQTCDWGCCDRQAVAVRLDVERSSPWDVWVSVCGMHSRIDDYKEEA